jgi:Dolichyl-phosphate-mannose-protein mannosyltransferase
MGEKFKRSALLVFGCGILLRVTLALVNLEANDDHIGTIRIIADENRIPDKNESAEAFQPKLYYMIVAAIWKIIPIQSLPIRIRIAQLVSCAAGILTLVLALRFFMANPNVSTKAGFFSFSLLALNPDLIAINAQATNDSFVILFGSLALYFGYLFFETHQVKDFVWMTTSVILAGLSKGNGLVVFVVILAVLGIAFLQKPHTSCLTRGRTILYGSIFLASFFAVVPKLGSYWGNYRLYGSPFVTNWSPRPLPNIFLKTAVRRPGVRSMAESLLTFPFFDMLRTPVITDDKYSYPQHRTSIWSQLYGRTHFVHFSAWPPSWRLPTDPHWEWLTRVVWHLGRLIFICALFPTILLLTAVFKEIRSAASQCIADSHKRIDIQLRDWLLYFAVFGYIAFIVIYSLRHQDFSFMKAIFIFPGLLGFLMLFARECNRFYAWCDQKRAVRISADAVFVLLLILYTADVLILIGQLGVASFSSQI